MEKQLQPSTNQQQETSVCPKSICIEHKKCAVERAQQVLLRIPGSVPITHVLAHNICNFCSAHPMPSSGLHKHLYTHSAWEIIQAPTHKYINNFSKRKADTGNLLIWYMKKSRAIDPFHAAVRN